MQVFEYKVVPAPEKGLKGKGLKGTRERFANALQTVMNELGAQGWEYVRADMLPCEERSGITGSTINYQNMLVFRRANVTEEPSFAPARPAPQPAPTAPAPIETVAPAEAPAPEAEPSSPVVEPDAQPAPTANDTSTEKAAAAAAQAALAAYRHQGTGAPRLGPATQD